MGQAERQRHRVPSTHPGPPHPQRPAGLWSQKKAAAASVGVEERFEGGAFADAGRKAFAGQRSMPESTLKETPQPARRKEFNARPAGRVGPERLTRPGRARQPRSSLMVETVQVHDHASGGDEVLHEAGLRAAAGMDLGQWPQLRVRTEAQVNSLRLGWQGEGQSRVQTGPGLACISGDLVLFMTPLARGQGRTSACANARALAAPSPRSAGEAAWRWRRQAGGGSATSFSPPVRRVWHGAS